MPGILSDSLTMSSSNNANNSATNAENSGILMPNSAYESKSNLAPCLTIFEARGQCGPRKVAFADELAVNHYLPRLHYSVNPPSAKKSCTIS